MADDYKQRTHIEMFVINCYGISMKVSLLLFRNCVEREITEHQSPRKYKFGNYCSWVIYELYGRPGTVGARVQLGRDNDFSNFDAHICSLIQLYCHDINLWYFSLWNMFG